MNGILKTKYTVYFLIKRGVMWWYATADPSQNIVAFLKFRWNEVLMIGYNVHFIDFLRELSYIIVYHVENYKFRYFPKVWVYSTLV